MLALLVLGIVGYAGAQTTPVTQGCCVANKFTATLLQLAATLPPLSSTPIIDDGYILLDYDYDNKMSRLEMHTLDQVKGTFNTVTILNDYTSSKIYTETNGLCTVTTTNASAMTPPCLVPSFQPLDTFTVGTGPSALTVDSWGGVVDKQRIFINLQHVDCTPISQSTYGDLGDGTREMTSYLFADVEQNKLSSANPFALSDACKAATPTPGRKRSIVSYFG